MYKLDLKERHACYNKNVSNQLISLNTSKFLYSLCWRTEPSLILDNGSGFSSFVFRKYKLFAKQPVRVISVDHYPKWLAATRSFLRGCGLVPEDTYLRSSFMKWFNDFEFDLILEDYYYPERSKALAQDVRMVSKKGCIVIDDVHLPSSNSFMRKLRQRPNIVISPLKNLADPAGRYPALLKKKLV